MEIFPSIILFTLTCLTRANDLDSSHDVSPVLSRTRRDLLAFGIMVDCANTRFSLDYNGYGCYCGLGGSGTPVDELDTCCKTHDNCYDSLLVDNGPCDSSIVVYVHPYVYTVQSCLTIFNQQSDNPPQPQIQCDAETNNPCKQALCKCDRVAAFCFADKNFDEDYRAYDKAANCSNATVTETLTKLTPTPSVGEAPPNPSRFIQIMTCMICAVFAYNMS